MTLVNRSSGDVKVKTSTTDKKGGFLETKLKAGIGVSITKETTGGNEQLVINATDPDQTGLHYLKCRVQPGGCVINMEVRPMFDQSMSFIQKGDC